MKELPKDLKISLNQFGKSNMALQKLIEWVFSQEEDGPKNKGPNEKKDL